MTNDQIAEQFPDPHMAAHVQKRRDYFLAKLAKFEELKHTDPSAHERIVQRGLRLLEEYLATGSIKGQEK